MQIISGQKEPVIKLLRELQTEEGRRRNGLFFAEEREIVRRAFDFGSKPRSFILTDKFAASDEAQALLERAAYAHVETYVTTSGLLAKILDAKPTPECVVIIERKVVSLPDIFTGECPLIQMVEHSENADNLGMLLRSTDAAGVTGVVLTADTTDPFSRRVVRGSRGAVFTVPICTHQDSAKAIEEARNHNLQIIATSANSQMFYTQADFTKPTMIIVGNEHVGISETVRELADATVRIPMLGKINSLNIAVAASVMLCEAVRQRQKPLS